MVGFVGNARRLWAAVDGVHAIDGMPVSHGHGLARATQGTKMVVEGMGRLSAARGV